MNKKKLIIILLIAIPFGFWTYDKLVDNVYVRYFYLQTWPEVPKTSYTKEDREEARKILSQPFSYLGKGRQFFVFESQDKKWVLKFLKCQRYSVWYKNIPFLQEKAANSRAIKTEKVQKTFSSLYLAATTLQDISGVTYCHIQKDRDLETTVTLVNPLGLPQTLSIDEVPFVIQRKAALVFETLEELYEKKDIESLKKRLSQLIQLQVDLVKKGCIDRDDGALLRNNIGFLADRAVYVDIGTFCRDDSAKSRLDEDLERLQPVLRWLKRKKAPLVSSQLGPWFEWQLQRACLENR